VQQRRLAGQNVAWQSEARPHLVIANEVLDAQPVHRLTVRDGTLRELRVDADLRWIEAVAPLEAHAYFERLRLLPPEGATAEVNLALAEWVQQLASRLPQGLAIILDYGYPAEALFSRPQGTLLTYYRHTLGSDPLRRLGEQDISVHVDFTTLATAARDAGLQVIGVTSQSALLRNLGLPTLLPLVRAPADRQAVQQLVDPVGLGRIGVLFLGRGLDGYTPAGLTADHTWPTPAEVPTLPDRDHEFDSMWQEAFASR
jgi:SAM-dependent MidA family methyltransferase